MVGSAAPGTPLADGGSSAGRRDRDRSAGLCRGRGKGGPVAKGGRVRGGGLYGIPVRMKLMFVLVGTTKLQVDVLKMPSLGGSGPVCPWILRRPSAGQ